MQARIDLRLGDCLEIMKEIPDGSVDSVVTDPPYGLSFMDKKWDYDVPSVAIWTECLRVLKPGGHLLCFAGTRTQHRMACRIEDAGFEIRDMIAWVYAQGFPKSHNLDGDKEGWGTALKPALEPITVARKPFNTTVAENVQAFGTGALNIDGCRVEGTVTTNPLVRNVGGFGSNGLANQADPPKSVVSAGRWPANLIHDGSDEVVSLFPQSNGQMGNLRAGIEKKPHNCFGDFGQTTAHEKRGDTGSAARFFYCAKASKVDRGEGNVHPTVKPTDLMRYLCRLVTPPAGVVLDPFMGSGSTGKACMYESFCFLGIEKDETYFGKAKERIEEEQQRNTFYENHDGK